MGQTWQEKLHKRMEPKVVVDKRTGKKLLVPPPILMDKEIRKVKKGKLVTMTQIREHLAKPFKADTTCPLCTGIFLRISAEAAEEEARAGRKEIAPWWRVVRDDGSLNEKMPGGVEGHASRLRKEGFSIEKAGKKLLVRDFEKSLQRL